MGNQRQARLPHLPAPWAGGLWALTSVAGLAVRCSHPVPRPNTAGTCKMAGCRPGRQGKMMQACQMIALFCGGASWDHLKVNQRHRLDLDCLAGFSPIFITCLTCFVHMQSLLIYYIQTVKYGAFVDKKGVCTADWIKFFFLSSWLWLEEISTKCTVFGEINSTDSLFQYS